MEVKDLSQTLLRTLNAISYYRKLNLIQISRATGIDYQTTIKQVNALKQMGLIREIEGEFERKIIPTFNRIETRYLKKHRSRKY